MQYYVKIVGVEEALKKFSAQKVARVVQSSLNETVKSTMSKASDLIRNEKGWRIKKEDFDRNVRLKLAQMNDLIATLTVVRVSAKTGKATGKTSFPLTYFGAKMGGSTWSATGRRARRAGVTVQVKRGGTTARFPRAFIATMKSGHRGVFRNIGGKASTGRDRIREIKVVTIAHMFRGTIKPLKIHARDYFAKRFKSKIKGWRQA